MTTTVMKELKQEFEVYIRPWNKSANLGVIIIKAEYNLDDNNGELIPAGRWYLRFDVDDKDVYIWTRTKDETVMAAAEVPGSAILPLKEFLNENATENISGEHAVLTRDMFWGFLMPILKTVMK